MDQRIKAQVNKDPRMKRFFIKISFVCVSLYMISFILLGYSKYTAAFCLMGASVIYAIVSVSKANALRNAIAKEIANRQAQETRSAEVYVESSPRSSTETQRSSRPVSSSTPSRSSSSSEKVVQTVETIVRNPAVRVATDMAVGAAVTKAMQKPVEALIPSRNPNIDRYAAAQRKAEEHRDAMNAARRPTTEKVGKYVIKSMPNGDQKLIFGNKTVGRYDKRSNATYKEGSFTPIAKGNALSSLMK